MTNVFRASDYYRSQFKLHELEYPLGHECDMCGQTAHHIYNLTIPFNHKKSNVNKIVIEICPLCLLNIKENINLIKINNKK